MHATSSQPGMKMASCALPVLMLMLKSPPLLLGAVFVLISVT
jgi:hypothetical protein